MKKVVSYLGWVLFAITFMVMMYFAFSKSTTIDFRGEVNEIIFSEEDNCAYIKATQVFHDAPMTIKVNKNISINDISGDKMYIEDIKIGDMIDLDYKGKYEKSTDIIIAKWIRVYPSK